MQVVVRLGLDVVDDLMEDGYFPVLDGYFDGPELEPVGPTG
jgi:hypothetical protein